MQVEELPSIQQTPKTNLQHKIVSGLNILKTMATDSQASLNLVLPGDKICFSTGFMQGSGTY